MLTDDEPLQLEAWARRPKSAQALAMRSPTDTALAIFASDAVAQVLKLPVLVRERVDVDPTFATRDLVRAPAPHAAPRRPRPGLGPGAAVRPRRWRAPTGADQVLPLRSEGDSASTFLRKVDRALGTHRTRHPSPLVVVAPPDVAAAFAAVSRHSNRLAGTIRANVPTAPLPELAARIGPVLERYLLSREQEVRVARPAHEAAPCGERHARRLARGTP